MSVIAFKIVQDRPPTLLSVFCVQAYWNDRGKLAEGRLQQFGSMEAALRAGKVAARRAAAVCVFRVRGNPEADYWEDPVTLAKYGERGGELGRWAAN